VANRCLEIQSQLEDIGAKYEISSKKLRSHERGLELRKRVETLQESGSLLFTDDASRQIAALALFRTELPHLVSDIAQLRNLWLELQSLKGRRAERTPLLARIDTLLELHDAASVKLLKDTSLAEVWRLAEYLKNPVLELAEIQNGDEVSQDATQVVEEPQEAIDVHGTPERQATTSVTALIDEEFAHHEPLQAFPPATTERELKEDFERARKRYMPVPIQWERIESLILLRQRLQERGYAVATHRLNN